MLIFWLALKRRGEDVKAAHARHAGQVAPVHLGHSMGRAAKFPDRAGAVPPLAAAPCGLVRACRAANEIPQRAIRQVIGLWQPMIPLGAAPQDTDGKLRR